MLKGLRGTFHTDNGIQTPAPEIAEAVRSSVKVLTEAGIGFEEKRPPGIEETIELFSGLFRGWDGGAWIRSLLERAGTTLDQTTLQRHLQAETAQTDDIVRLINRWDQIRVRMLAFMDNNDVIIAPANAYPAIPHGTFRDRYVGFSYTMTYNLTGWPGTVVRVGTSRDGLPVGVQIVARPWREEVTLAIAQHLEKALGGWQRPPI